MWREDEGFLQRHRGKIVIAVLAGSGFLAYRATHGCLSLWFKGLDVPYCPEGEIRQVATLRADGIQREQESRVLVGARAFYARGSKTESHAVSHAQPSLFLVDQGGTETQLATSSDFDSGAEAAAKVKFPAVPDGDYLLRARVKTAFGESQIDAPLALYAPARVHVITDRPVYQPGETLHFRALVVRARDLGPLEKRPGEWVVTDPQGDVVLDERAPSGAWGVTTGTFPLDRAASDGVWRVRWESGGTSDEVSVQVRPFATPRFRVDATPDKPFYRPGDHPVLRGTATYGSGAPLNNARVRVTWTHEGNWPVPDDWDEGALPSSATTDKNGAFRLSLPEVPGDLRGKTTLSASIVATDDAGDSLTASATVLLSEDGIDVSAVTELPGGLAPGVSNRLYLRVTNPAGDALPRASIQVRRAWDPSAQATAVATDEDGVAALEIDPGAAASIVIPPMPVRAPPLTNAVARTGLTDLLTQADAPLPVVRAVDALQPRLQSCARYVRAALGGVIVDLRVRHDGRVEAIPEGDDLASRCLGRSLGQTRLPSASDGLYAARFSIASPLIPDLKTDVSGGSGALEDAATFDSWTLDARSCLPRDVESGPYPEQLIWQVEADSQDFEQSWRSRPGGIKLPTSVTNCVRGKFAEADLEQPALKAAVGVVRFDITAVPRPASAAKPKATVMMGYELVVTATDGPGGHDIGTTKVRVRPAEIPPVRLRATPVLAEPSDTVTVDFLRRTSSSGRVPETLVMQGAQAHIEAGVDSHTGAAQFHLPADAAGWYTVTASGTEARVFVRPKAGLSVVLASDRASYAPGEKARLTVQVLQGGKLGAPVEAGVGLFGVDQSLAQLAPLPGADDLSRLQPPAQMQDGTLPALDGVALASGRVKGAHAAEAVIARVIAAPKVAESGNPVSVSSEGTIDVEAEDADVFYAVLAELHTQVHEWETHAGDDKLRATDVARLWNDSIAACEQRGDRVTDAFHRRLRLSALPGQLLALTDPSALVSSAAHRADDLESWASYVSREKP